MRQDGKGPIPVTAVWQWQDRNGITDPGLRRFTEDVFATVDMRTLTRRGKPATEEPDNRPPGKQKPR